MKEKWGYQTKHTQTRSKKPFQAKLRKSEQADLISKNHLIGLDSLEIFCLKSQPFFLFIFTTSLFHI